MAKVSGSCHIEGNAEAGDLRVSGSAHIGGSVRVSGSMKISGSTSISGEFEGGDLASSGSIRIGKDLRAKALRISGGARIGGRTKADTIEVKIYSEDIEFRGGVEGGDMVVERAPESHAIRIFGLASLRRREAGYVRAPDIRCTGTLSLEHTICEYVEASSVSVGPGCQIGTARYRENVSIHPDAQVRREPEKI